MAYLSSASLDRSEGAHAEVRKFVRAAIVHNGPAHVASKQTNMAGIMEEPCRPHINIVASHNAYLYA